MGTIIVISMIFVLLILTNYTLSRFIGKTMKKYLPVLTVAIFLSVLSGCGADITAELDEEAEKNEELTSEIAELESTNSSLQEEYDELKSQFNELTEEVTQLNEENEKLEDYESIKTENESLSEEIATLKENNNELQKQLDEKQEANVSGNYTSENSSEATSDTSQSSSGECEIKGSTSGIYHTPGSTYYNQTKNVVQWFCSEEEAQEAGYRAPKR